MDMFIDIYELKMILNLVAKSWNLTLEDEIETESPFGCSNDGYIFENEDEMLSTKQKIYCHVKPNTHQIDKIELFHDGENRIVSYQAYKNSRPLVNFKYCANGDDTKSEIQNFMDYWIMKNPPNKYI